MNRRRFLRMASSGLLVAAAPAIVRFESLMKLPPKRVIADEYGYYTSLLIKSEYSWEFSTIGLSRMWVDGRLVWELERDGPADHTLLRSRYMEV